MEKPHLTCYVKKGAVVAQDILMLLLSERALYQPILPLTCGLHGASQFYTLLPPFDETSHIYMRITQCKLCSTSSTFGPKLRSRYGSLFNKWLPSVYSCHLPPVFYWGQTCIQLQSIGTNFGSYAKAGDYSFFTISILLNGKSKYCKQP